MYRIQVFQVDPNDPEGDGTLMETLEGEAYEVQPSDEGTHIVIHPYKMWATQNRRTP